MRTADGESRPESDQLFRSLLQKAPASAATATGDSGRETILFVDDEPAVRRLGSLVLCYLGYDVIEAADGEEALQLVNDRGDQRIDLLVTDVEMPRMGGKDLADRLRNSHPETKVLFTSVYTDDDITKHGVLQPRIAFLQKPYTTALLARKVREVLDEGRKRQGAEA